MPKQKDLKRVVRTRMQKTGESYTAARLQVLEKKNADYAALAGMSDAVVKEKTGREWAAWTRALDAVHASEKPHREIVKHVASLGTSSWWSQMVAVGYERIRGLRTIGQKRSGMYAATKSRTFAVPVERLFRHFADKRMRARWLPVNVTVRTSRANKSMRLTWDDDTSVAIGFLAKSRQRSAVAIEHSKLTDQAAAGRVKAMWAERLEALAGLLA